MRRWFAGVLFSGVMLGGLMMPAGHAPVQAAVDTGWTLKVDDQNHQVQVFTRKASANRTEFRGITRLKTSLSSLVALLKDVERLPQWAYRTTLAMRIATVSPREAIVYSVAHLSWPFQDRDLIMRTRLTQDPVSLVVRVEGEAVPDFLPPDPNYVRVPFLRSSWTFTPVGDGLVEVEFRGYGDAGGNLSSGLLSWITQQVVSEAPHQSLIGLRRMIRQARYQRAVLDIIREPAASASAAIDSIQGISATRSAVQ